MSQAARFIFGQSFLTFVFFIPVCIATERKALSSELVKISEVQTYFIDEKRDINNSFDTEDQKNQGLPIDPFDLMNRLKQAGAMNNATTPSDALDEALNVFDQSGYENVPIK